MLSEISLAHAEATRGPAVWATFQRQKLRLWANAVPLRLWTVAALSDRPLRRPRRPEGAAGCGVARGLWGLYRFEGGFAETIMRSSPSYDWVYPGFLYWVCVQVCPRVCRPVGG